MAVYTTMPITDTSMNVVRARSIEVIKLIAPHLTFSDARLKQPFIEELAHKMIEAPDSVMVLVSLNGLEDDLRAFLIAHNPGPALPYITLAQVWSHPENPPSWSELFFAKLVMWAIVLDKDYIRAETMRNVDALYRRYGFEPLSHIVKLDLSKQEFLTWEVSSNPT